MPTDDCKEHEPGSCDFDAIVVGAGHAGLYALHRLRQAGFKVLVLEGSDDIGGTWYQNRYPGLRCDVESLVYSYSFDETLDVEWKWSERFPPQPEILEYLRHVADRFDLRRDIRLNERVEQAEWNEAAGTWSLTTDKGEIYRAQFCILATGILSVPSVPGTEQIGPFKGKWYHTGAWPKEGVDFTGLRVGVIGTGSSAVQSIPRIAEQAALVTVFQRTAAYAIPAHNRPLTEEDHQWWRKNFRRVREANRWGTIIGFGDVRIDEEDRVYHFGSALDATPEERAARYQKLWDQGGGQVTAAYPDLIVNQEANDTLAAFIHGKIREIVKDPKTADLLCPAGFPAGTKRPCLEIGYYEAFNRPNVTLMDARSDPIASTTEYGVRLQSGKDIELDAIVYATGYDAVTGAMLRMDIRGTDGLTIQEKWRDGPLTNLGIGLAGFPNLFTILGAQSPSAFTNCVVSIEQHIDWVADCVSYMRKRHVARIDSDPAAETAWGDHCATLVNATLFPKGTSWYMGDNIPGKPRRMLIYVGGVKAYREKCDEVAANGYEGFIFARQQAA